MNRTTRNDPWLPAFHALLARHAALPFAWGVHDCATVALAVARLARGATFPAPRWVSERGARRLLRDRSLLQYALDAFGDPIPWGDCIVGDLAIAQQPNDDPILRQALVIHDGTRFLVPDAGRGFRAVYPSQLLLGWRL